MLGRPQSVLVAGNETNAVYNWGSKIAVYGASDRATVQSNRLRRDLGRTGFVLVKRGGTAPDSITPAGFGPFGPVVIGAGIAFRGPRVIRNRSRVYSATGARIGAIDWGGDPNGHRGFGPAPPVVVNAPEPDLAPINPPIQGHLAPLRGSIRPATMAILRPPTVVTAAAAALARPPLVHLAYSRRGKPLSGLGRPIVLNPNDAYPQGPMVQLAPSSRGKPKSRLAPSAVVTPEVTATFAGPRVTLAPSRRGKPKPRLAPPSVVFTAVELDGPNVTLARIRPPRTLALLRKPVVIDNSPQVYYLATTLAYSSRGKPLSFLRRPTDLVDAADLGLVHVHLAYSRRGTPKSRLSPPAVVGPVLARSILVHLAPSSRGKAKPHLSAPAVVAPVLARAIVTKLVQIRPVRTTYVLRRPTDLVDAADLGYVRVHLAYSLRGKPKSRLSPPAVVAPVLARAILVRLARIRPVATHSILRRPTDLVDQADIGFVRVHLAYSLRGKAKPHLSPPAVVAPVLARSIDVSLVRIRPVPTRSRLGPPVVVYLAVELSGPEVTLAPSFRGKPKSHLGPATDLVDQQDLGRIKVTLAPQRRGAPHSSLKPATVVFTAVELSGPEVTLVRIRPPQTRWFLRPQVAGAAVLKAETTLAVTLAYSLRGQPKSKLKPPTVVTAPSPYLRPIDITFAPQSRGKAKSFLRPPAVVGPVLAPPIVVKLARIRPPAVHSKLRLTEIVSTAVELSGPKITLVRIRPPRTEWFLRPPVAGAAVLTAEYDLKITLAPQRRGRPIYELRPPTVVYEARIFEPIRVTLARITPPPVHSILRPPAVVGAGIYFRGVLVHLTYSLRGKPKSKLSFTERQIEECYGTVAGFDFAPEVCGDDEGAVVGGSDTGDMVCGSDSAATIEGATASSGSVTGGDEKREGC
jgi:hypothetical protein